MRPIEIVERIKKTDPDALGGIPDNKAAAFVRSVFQEIARVVDETDQGEVKIPRFGSFRIKQIEREKDGEKIVRKQILFRPAPNK